MVGLLVAERPKKWSLSQGRITAAPACTITIKGVPFPRFSRAAPSIGQTYLRASHSG